jgi:PKD repeat protein
MPEAPAAFQKAPVFFSQKIKLSRKSAIHEPAGLKETPNPFKPDIMRKLYLLCVLLASFLSGSAQDNVQFNAVAQGLSVNFQNQSAITDTAIKRAFWSFGDGTSAVTAPRAGIIHAYNQPGTYTVCLRIYRMSTNLQDTVALTGTNCIQVAVVASGVPDSCTAAYSFQQNNTILPAFFSFQAQAGHNHNKPVLTACWTWGDGTVPVCNQASSSQPAALGASHTYTAAGNFLACVSLNYDGGCSSSACHTIAVAGPAVDSCTANFSYIASTAGSNAASFSAIPSSSPQHPVTKVCWSFGDGSAQQCSQIATGVPPSLTANHTFPGAGTYNVCVTITYDGGCHATRCSTVTVQGTPPSLPDSCRAGFSAAVLSMNPGGYAIVGFTAQPWHNNQRRVTKICYNWGDGRDTCINYSNGYNGAGVTHLFQPLGTYNVCVAITYDGGCSSSFCHDVVLQAPPPPADSCHAEYTLAPVTATPLARTFTAIPWHNNQKRVTKVCWLFGNGRDTCINYPAGYTGTYSVRYDYPAYGTYTACVVITYEGGCHSTSCHSIVIMPPPPPASGNCSANFVELSTSNTGLQRHILAIPDSSHRPLRICWNWGDNSAATCIQQPNPATATSLTAGHSYAAQGSYLVCVRIEYDGGCVAQKCAYVQAHALTNCAVSFRDTAISSNELRLEATGITDPGDSILSYRWVFGDGTSTLGRLVQHTYLSGGTYQVCVVMHTRSGCEARECHLITVNAPSITLLTLLPNPVSTTLHANFYSLAQGTATLRIINSLGLVLRTETRPCYPGMNFWNLNVDMLPAGLYTLIVQAPNQYAAKSFFKQ